jgi:hypothetical protein
VEEEEVDPRVFILPQPARQADQGQGERAAVPEALMLRSVASKRSLTLAGMVRAALAGLDQKGDGAGEGKIDSEEPLAEGETGLAALTGCDGLPSALQDAPVIRPHPPSSPP